MTINDLAASYLEMHASRLRTGNQFKRRFERDIIPVIGNVPLAQFHRRDATRMLDAITRRGAPVGAMRAFEDLRAMLRWGVARGDLDHNPIDGMRKPQGSKPTVMVRYAL
jgi:site-specific recombinase XerC